MKKIILFGGIFIVTSCNLTGVKVDDGEERNYIDSLFTRQSKKTDTLTSVENNEKKQETESNDEHLLPEKSVKEQSYPNGININWKKHGQGKSIKKGDMIRIDYRNKLMDGTVYDGNHLIQKPSLPFFVGWNMQTEGWDFALSKLREGDEVEILIPADLARGEKGIPGVVPPNADNLLSLKVIEIIPPTYEVDDIRIWRVEERKNPGKKIEFEDKVEIHYWVSSSSKPRFDNSYQRGIPFELVMGDGNIVPGLYKALHYGREGDKLMIHIPAKEAYGKDGLKGLVEPNEDLFYDLIILDVYKKSKS